MLFLKTEKQISGSIVRNKTYMLTDGKFSERIFSEGIAELLRFEPFNCRVPREP
jgi:hypothetical protein